MERKMTWKEMKESFPDEWLLIINFDLDNSGRLKTGVVERHSKHKTEVYTTKPAGDKSIALRYTGESKFFGLRSHVND